MPRKKRTRTELIEELARQMMVGLEEKLERAIEAVDEEYERKLKEKKAGYTVKRPKRRS